MMTPRGAKIDSVVVLVFIFTLSLVDFLFDKSYLSLYILGYFYILFVPGGGFAPLSKNRLVSDRIEIFWLLKLFFVRFLKINFLRL